MNKSKSLRPAIKDTHDEFVVTVTDRFGEREISSTALYSSALFDVLRFAKEHGGRLEPAGSNAWNLYQTGSTPRINIVTYEVENS